MRHRMQVAQWRRKHKVLSNLLEERRSGPRGAHSSRSAVARQAGGTSSRRRSRGGAEPQQRRLGL